MIRYSILLLLLVLLGGRALSQTVYSRNPESASLYPTKHWAFENYAFVMDGKVIEHQVLSKTPGVKLNNVFPFPIKLEGQSYLGAVYFHTAERYAPPIRYANDPAYFVNNRQISPDHFRMTNVDAYNRIEKSARDTTIGGMLYKGAIHVDTDEDFWADHITLPELIKKYTGLPPEHVIVHWRSSKNEYTYEDDIGTIIRDNFPIYSFNIVKLGIRAVEVDRVLFAEGERYVVHIVDNSYKWIKPKVSKIFEEPMAVDTASPCYLSNSQHDANTIFTRTEIDPRPYRGKEAYLKKLSEKLNLTTEQPVGRTTADSITVQFIVLKDGMLTALESTDVNKTEHGDILEAIKKTACIWSPAIQGGRPVVIWRKMTIHYSKDGKGNIRSLDDLTYRYDIQQPKKLLL